MAARGWWSGRAGQQEAMRQLARCPKVCTFSGEKMAMSRRTRMQFAHEPKLGKRQELPANRFAVLTLTPTSSLATCRDSHRMASLSSDHFVAHHDVREPLLPENRTPNPKAGGRDATHHAGFRNRLFFDATGRAFPRFVFNVLHVISLDVMNLHGGGLGELLLAEYLACRQLTVSITQKP